MVVVPLLARRCERESWARLWVSLRRMGERVWVGRGEAVAGRERGADEVVLALSFLSSFPSLPSGHAGWVARGGAGGDKLLADFVRTGSSNGGETNCECHSPLDRASSGCMIDGKHR